MAPIENKAHTATANRIATNFGTTYNSGQGFDIQTDQLTIEVETTATVQEAIGRLSEQPGKVYVALTNQDGVSEAIRLVANTKVGVMDPHGKIVRECE